MTTQRIPGSFIGFTKRGKPIYLIAGGSEPTFDTPVVDDSQGPETDTGTEGAAPWADYIKDLPDGVKVLVEPKFKEWDSNYTKGINKVHSQYEPLKPFQELVDSGVDFETVQQAVQFAQLVNQDPERVYNALVEQYGFGSEQGQVEPPVGQIDLNNQPTAEDLANNPEFAKYREMTEQMAQIMVSQQEAQQMAQEEAALTAHLASLHEQHGEFDEDYVLTKVYAGASWEDAINSFSALRGPIDAPVVMGSGGGLPTQSVSPAQMSDKDRKNLVAQIAAQANK